jgi:hypothetical protein
MDPMMIGIRAKVYTCILLLLLAEDTEANETFRCKWDAAF